jgi:thioredoxin reductase
VVGYGGDVQAGQALSAARDGNEFAIELDTGHVVRARRLLATAGATDELPDVPGLAARWGRDVVHCPYCHGWEIRDQPIGVLATSPLGVHQALLFRQWSHRLTLLLHTAPRPTAEETEQLAARRITVVSGEVTGLEVTEDRLSGVRLQSGKQIPLRALAAAPRPVPRAELLAALGLAPTPHPSGLGAYIAADPTGLTPVPGVWVAGNLADPNANVLGSAASGSMAAGAINADLIAEDTRQAVRSHRDPFSPAAEARVCEQIMGDRRHGL